MIALGRRKTLTLMSEMSLTEVRGFSLQPFSLTRPFSFRIVGRKSFAVAEISR
jgi:hypothetical protein